MTILLTSFATDFSSAVDTLLRDYKSEAGINLQIVSARPKRLFAPSAWQDVRREDITFTGTHGTNFIQSTSHIEVVVIHGLFDSEEAVAQRDAFRDGFVSWVRSKRDDLPFVINGMTVLDIPNFTADWQPPEEQRTYFATVITLEGYIED